MARISALNTGFVAPARSGSFVDTLNAWYVRWQERRELASLDQRALDDIGLSRGDVLTEVSKPFWRA
ncbi:MAG: DUF1127 domain-containing protein [Elstera sp.]